MNLGEQHFPLRTLVLEDLRERIITGRLEAGSRIIEDQIASELGVSRNPVREALRILEAEGLVQMSARRGAVVASIGPDEVTKVFEVRIALESLAARLAARKATDQEIADLHELLATSRRTAEGAADDEGAGETASTSARELGRGNNDFHARIHQIAGNRYLAEVMQAIAGRMEWIFRQNALVRAPGSHQEHVAIVAAIEAHDEDGAAEAAAEHVRSAEAAFMALDQRGASGGGSETTTEPAGATAS